MSTSFKPCVVIPVYNHGQTVASIVTQLRAIELPIILVDDGSLEDTRSELKRIADTTDECHLEILNENQGKGGAVLHGFSLAYSLGYTHALQVDADGQHDLSIVGDFLNEAASRPDAMIAGFPVYDDSVPHSRKFGRLITNFWVAIETISLDIKDAMCGFRVYPLSKTHNLMKKRSLAKRMDFDIDILVKLHWTGMQMIFKPISVIYPEDGISHFRMLQDNVAISWIHTKLVIEMVIRIPVIMFNKFSRRK
ncbi:MAG: glycosyltransferase family 2 protein [Fibrobacterales bacterium]